MPAMEPPAPFPERGGVGGGGEVLLRGARWGGASSGEGSKGKEVEGREGWGGVVLLGGVAGGVVQRGGGDGGDGAAAAAAMTPWRLRQAIAAIEPPRAHS